jgi:hypothetical protein
MNGEALVTPARTSGAKSAVCALFPILARASGLSQLGFIARVVEDAERLRVEGVHLMEDFVLSVHVASAANVEVLVQQLFTSITVHVHIGQLLGAYFAKEIARTISDDNSCKQRFLALKE